MCMYFKLCVTQELCICYNGSADVWHYKHLLSAGPKMRGIRNNIAEIGTFERCWNVEWSSGNNFGSSSKLKERLPCDPGIPLLGIYPTKLKTGT